MNYKDMYENLLEELSKVKAENEELKEKNTKWLEDYIALENLKDTQIEEQMTRNRKLAGQVASLNRWSGEAKDIIKELLIKTYGEGWNYSLDAKVRAENFLKGE